MNILEKRKEAFLTGKARLNSFTKEAVVTHYGLLSSEFDQLITDKFIEPLTVVVCESCFRPIKETQDKEDGCLYCGRDEFSTLTDLYCYVIKKESGPQ